MNLQSNWRLFYRAVFSLLFLGLLQACGASDNAFLSNTTTASALRLGSGAGATFQDSNVSVAESGSTTTVSVNLVDDAGNLSTTGTQYTFTSTCVTQGLASFDNELTTTSTGTVSAIYTNQSCTIDNIFTVTATIIDTQSTLTASTTISAQAAPASGSIAFSSVSNSLISLKGLGTSAQPETTTVTFTVLGFQGQPISGKNVNFTLNTAIGGLSFAGQISNNPPLTNGTSDSAGIVSAIVKSGSLPTTFRVTAVDANDSTIATQSSTISVATGPATQNALSLGASILNPRGFTFNNTESIITAHAADRYGNPIQDGTSISFTTEGGIIEPNCTTTGGACSVKWVSANPRPSNGRATILAYLTGEESFTDNNSNGVFDDADIFKFGNISETIFADDDLPEAFRDDNENGLHDTGEFFHNLDSSDIAINNGYTNDNGKLSSLGCTSNAGLCSDSNSITIFRNLVLVMAEDGARFEDNIGTGSDGLDNLTIANNGTQNIVYTINGLSTGQALPINSTVSFATSGSSDCVIEGTSSFTRGSTNADPSLTATSGVNDYSVKYVCSGTAGSGTMTITVNIPDVIDFTRSINITQQ